MSTKISFAYCSQNFENDRFWAEFQPDLQSRREIWAKNIA